MWQSVVRNIKTFVFFTIYYHKCLILNLLKNVVCHPHIIWIITYHLTIDKIFFDNRIKHQKELVGKSTATHACILAPGNVSIHNFPVSLCCILNHQKNLLSILSYSFISFIHIIFYSLILFLSPGSSRFSRK